MIRPCDTFHYVGTVPQTKAERDSGEWILQDQSGAATRVHDGWNSDGVRLVGLRPSLRFGEGHLVLQAEGPERALVSSVRLEFDTGVLGVLEGGDEIELIRTGTSDFAVSVLRAGRLVWAIGAVTHVRLGKGLVARNPSLDFSRWDGFKLRGQALLGRIPTLEDIPPLKADCVQFSGQNRTAKVREGETVTVGEYMVTVVRTLTVQLPPGEMETVAISRGDDRLHAATLRAAALLGRRPATAVRFRGVDGEARRAMAIRFVDPI